MTRPICRLVLAIGLVLALFRPAHAQFTGIYVEYYTTDDLCPGDPSSGDGWAPCPNVGDRGGGCPGSSPQPGLAYGSTVYILAGTGLVYRVYAADGQGAIGDINVGGSGYTLLVGKAAASAPFPFTQRDAPLEVAGGGAIGNISATGGTIQVRSSGTVGNIYGDSVVRVDARDGVGAVGSNTTIGTVRAPNIGNVTAQGAISAVLAQNWDSGAAVQDYSATISSTAGNIGRVEVIGARMRGSVTTDQGGITTSVTSSVGIGPASGTPSTIRARDGITRVEAPSINANVDARYNSGSGLIQTVNATAGGFAGSLQSAGIGTAGTGVFVAGNLAANVTVTGAMQRPFTVIGASSGNLALTGALPQPVSLEGGVTSGSLSFGPLSSTLTIGGDLARPIFIDSIAAGASASIAGSLTGDLTVGLYRFPVLAGQVVINAANTGGTWSGTALVSGEVLSPLPYYTTFPSSVLGGGAVGLVPFNVYRVDSSPPSSSDTVSGTGYLLAATVAHTGQTPTIVVSHYGPVRAAATGLPVAIEYSATG